MYAPTDDTEALPQENHWHWASNVMDPDTGKSLPYRHLITDPATAPLWNRSSADEFGRLAQGVRDRVKGTDTIFFIKKDQVPKGQGLCAASDHKKWTLIELDSPWAVTI